MIGYVNVAEQTVWKHDPDDRGLVHTVHAFAFGSATTHCGKVFEVDTARNEPPAKWDTGCARCREARSVEADYPASAWDTSSDYGPR